MASYWERAKAAMDKLNLIMSDADPNKIKTQLNKSQCTYLYKIIENAFTINDIPTDSSSREDSGPHQEENSSNTSHLPPDSQLENPGSPGGEILEPPDNKDSAEWRELCFAIEHAQVLIRRCCNEKVLEAAILQTDLTEEISTLVSFFSSIVESSDYKPQLADKCKEDMDALQKLLKTKKRELKEQDQGDLAAYLLERFYEKSTLKRAKHRPTRSNKWSVDPSKLGSAGQRLGKGASGFIYETTWLGETFSRKFFLGTTNPGFEAEASALVDLRHLNIVHTFCWAKDRRSYSLVLEMFGTDLHTYVQKKKESERKIIALGQQQSSSTQADLKNHLAPFGSEKWLLPGIRIMLQIAAGMQYLHEKGVAHGDLEPNNILVKPVLHALDASHHLHVKVVDFGLTQTRWWRAQYSDEDGKERDAIGFQWKAPEQFTVSATDDSLGDKAPSTKEIRELQVADVYIFATICLYILIGGLPVKDSESEGGQAPYKLPQDSCCPKPLKELLQRCWTADPKTRPSFAAICEGLRHIHTDHMPKFKKDDLSTLETCKRRRLA